MLISMCDPPASVVQPNIKDRYTPNMTNQLSLEHVHPIDNRVSSPVLMRVCHGGPPIAYII